MDSDNCRVCNAPAKVYPYPDRDAAFIDCPACGRFDVPETTALLILKGLRSVQRAILSFWLRHQQRGEDPLVLTDELTKRVLEETKLPTADEQEDNLVRLVGKAGVQWRAGDCRLKTPCFRSWCS